MRDVWGGGQSYEQHVGRWSRAVAREFVAGLGVAKQSRWLDLGCGTGALTQVILEQGHPLEVIGVDPAAGFIEYAREHVRYARARFEVGDADHLPVPPGYMDTLVSGLVLNFIPQPERALAGLREAVRPGGMVAAYVWDYAEGMQFMRYFWDAAAALDPKARDLDEGRRFPICNPDALDKLFRDTSLQEVHTRAIDIETDFASFEDFWQPFLGGQGPAPSYVSSLQDDRREALRERLRDTLPYTADGRIRLTARAWAVRGVKKG